MERDVDVTGEGGVMWRAGKAVMLTVVFVCMHIYVRMYHGTSSVMLEFVQQQLFVRL